MNKIYLFFLLLISFENLKSQNYSGPESVEFDYANNRYLISNTTSKTIIARDAAGNRTTFLSGFTSGPHGLEIVGNTLYACDGSRVKGYNLTTKAQVMNINLGATFLNGITHDNNGNLYVTDFSAKKIYRINHNAQTFNLYVTGLTKSPNGIIFDQPNNRLVFVNWGTNAPVNAINMADSSVSTLTTTTLGNCDGIATDGNGKFYVSAWSTNSVHLFTGNFTTAPVNVWSGLSNPADIFYNVVSDTLACPNAGNNTVVFKYFGTTVMTKEINKKTSIHVFPNPSNGILNISNPEQIEIENISLYDVTGKEIFNWQTASMQNFTFDISTMNLKNGVYFIKALHRDKIIFQEKFLYSEE